MAAEVMTDYNDLKESLEVARKNFRTYQEQQFKDVDKETEGKKEELKQKEEQLAGIHKSLTKIQHSITQKEAELAETEQTLTNKDKALKKDLEKLEGDTDKLELAKRLLLQEQGKIDIKKNSLIELEEKATELLAMGTELTEQKTKELIEIQKAKSKLSNDVEMRELSLKDKATAISTKQEEINTRLIRVQDRERSLKVNLDQARKKGITI